MRALMEYRFGSIQLLLTMLATALSSCCTLAATAQFVEVTTELEVSGYFRKGMERTLRVSAHTHSATVIFGTNTWLIDEPRPGFNERNFWLFADAAITHYSAEIKTNTQAPKTFPPIRDATDSSQDGNPGRPVGAADSLSYTAFVNWYAFCSAHTLNRRERALFPPSDLWKRYVSSRRFDEDVVRFEDSLGLPRSLDLFTTNRQPVFQYRIAAYTNFAGWNIPLEFHVVQYDSVGTNAWQVQFTAKGKVKSIRETTRPMVVLEE